MTSTTAAGFIPGISGLSFGIVNQLITFGEGTAPCEDGRKSVKLDELRMDNNQQLHVDGPRFYTLT